MSVKDFMQEINKNHSNTRIAIAVTGGGTGVIGEMLRYGGSSATFVYGHVPYAPEQTIKYIGSVPDKICSPETARMMAAKAFHDINDSKENDKINPVGIGATSSLGKLGPEREGREHKICIAVQTREQIVNWTINLKKPRSREEEELLTEEFIIKAFGTTFLGFPEQEKMEIDLDESETLEILRTEGDQLETIFHGSQNSLCFCDNKYQEKNPRSVNLVFSAAFNPVHDAHLLIAKIASEMIGYKCDFEMSIVTPHKPPLTYTDIQKRVEYFENFEYYRENKNNIWLTRMPTFLEKARFFAPVTFAVGTDTVDRICDPKYYDNSETKMLEALKEMAEKQVKFICFAREVDGKIKKAISDNVPQEFKDIAIPVDHKIFASGLSSREIRMSK